MSLWAQYVAHMTLIALGRHFKDPLSTFWTHYVQELWLLDLLLMLTYDGWMIIWHFTIFCAMFCSVTLRILFYLGTMLTFLLLTILLLLLPVYHGRFRNSWGLPVFTCCESKEYLLPIFMALWGVELNWKLVKPCVVLSVLSLISHIEYLHCLFIC